MSLPTISERIRRLWLALVLCGALLLVLPLSRSAAQTGELPKIVTQPKTQQVLYGQRAVLTVAATGGSLSYQWYVGFSGDTRSPILNATSNTYITEPLVNTYRYWVRVSNAVGSIDSNTARVEVEPEQPGIYTTRLPFIFCGQGCYPTLTGNR